MASLSSEAADRRARLPLALMRLGVRRPRLVLALWGLACAAALPGVLMLQVDTSTDSVLDRRHPDWQRYQESQDRFGGDEIIVVALRGDTPFDPDVISRVEALSNRFETLGGVRRVDSIATVPVVRLDEHGDLELQPALWQAPGEARALSRHVAERLERDRIAPGSLVSDDGRVFALNLVLERGAEARHAELLEELYAIVEPAGGVLSGVPVFRVAANERTGSEILLFAPVTALLIGLFLTAVFGALRVVLIGTVPGLLGSWMLIAAMGYSGAKLSITTMVLPSIILALGCAYAMHLLAAASGAKQGGQSLEAALARVTLPVALSGLTTVVGFVSITVVQIDAVRFAGGYGALGVLVVTAVSLTLLPAALRSWPLPDRPPRGFAFASEQLGPWLVGSIARQRTPILIAWATLTLIVASGLWRMDVQTDATRWLPPGNPVRDSYDEIRSALSGISPMNVVIEAPEGGSVLAPECLAAIDELSTYLRSLPEVGKVLSIADPLRQINGEFQNDLAHPLPDTGELSAQYLVLLESVDQIDDLISLDHRSANIMLRVDDNASSHLMWVAEQARGWWAEHGAPGHQIVTTGIMYEFARAEDEISYGQLRGLGLALLVISLILFAIFRSPRVALVALVPNAIPLLIVFGVMGLLGLPIDAGTVMIGGLALGVAVDDTIHIVTSFRERIEADMDPRAALEQTFRSVLPPVLSTTVMISAAFFVLAFSEFTITRNLGLLTGGIMLLCLLTDLTLLSALLLPLGSAAGVTGCDQEPVAPALPAP